MCGAARRLAIAGTSAEAAAAELRGISTSPNLLGQAAGTFMAGHRHDSALRPFDRRAADLLLAAGADLEAAEPEAAVVRERLGREPG